MTSDPAVPGLLFATTLYLGTVLHTFRYARSITDIKLISMGMAVSALALLPGKKEHPYYLVPHFVLAGIYFSIVMALFFRKQVMGHFNEQYLLHVNIIYGFFLLTHLSWKGPTAILLFLGLLPSAHTLVLVFFPRPFKIGVTMLSYLWFFLMSIITLMGTAGGTLWHIYAEKGLQTMHLWEAVTAGPAFFLLVAYCTYLFQFIPWPGKHQTMSERIHEMRLMARELHLDFDHSQLRIRHSFLILLIQSGALWIAYKTHWISITLAINACLIIFSILISPQEEKKGFVKR